MSEPKPPQQPKKPETSIEKIVWSEIDLQKPPSHVDESKWTPEKRASYYLNNFYCKLPSEIARMAYEHWDIRNKDFERAANKEARIKKKHSEWYNNDNVKEERYKFSPKFLDETEEEFLNDIDIAIKESGVDLQKLIEYITIIDDDHHKYDPKVEIVLLLPIYITLRKMSYTHRDLAT